MIRYQCEVCDRLKGTDGWIFGFAAERVGITEARREITVIPKWDEMRARAELAVHFCSEECKQEYMARLFGEEASRTSTTARKKAVGALPRKRTKAAKRNKKRAA